MKLLPLIGLTALLSACGGDGDSNNSAQPGVQQPETPAAPQPTQMSLSFSDAPVDAVSKVCIAVANVSVHPVSGTEMGWSPASFQNVVGLKGDDDCTPIGEAIPLDGSREINTLDDEGNPIVEIIPGNPRFSYIDLLAYQGGSSRSLLDSRDVAPGVYSQLRLQVLDGFEPGNQFGDGTPYSYVKQVDGTIKPLVVPGSELRLGPLTIAANSLNAFTAEFDLRRAMVLTDGGDYILRPRGLRLVNNSEVTTVKGAVDAEACGGTLTGKAFVYFYQPQSDDNYQDMADSDNGFYASAPVVPQTDGGFGYQLGFVNLGNYDVALVCNGDEDDPELAGDPLQLESVKKNVLVRGRLTPDINF